MKRAIISALLLALSVLLANALWSVVLFPQLYHYTTVRVAPADASTLFAKSADGINRLGPVAGLSTTSHLTWPWSSQKDEWFLTLDLLEFPDRFSLTQAGETYEIDGWSLEIIIPESGRTVLNLGSGMLTVSGNLIITSQR